MRKVLFYFFILQLILLSIEKLYCVLETFDRDFKVALIEFTYTFIEICEWRVSVNLLELFDNLQSLLKVPRAYVN